MRTKSTVGEFTSGPMAESTTENGKKIICTARVSTPGRTVVCMKETTKMIASTATASTHGMTASSTRAGGRMESNMAKASIERTVAIEEVFGKTARESNGSEERTPGSPTSEYI